MISRRVFFVGDLAGLASNPIPSLAARKAIRRKFSINPRYAPQTVSFRGHFLYLVLPFGRARRYDVGFGKVGLRFKGTARVGRKAKWPSWRPTDNMIRRQPGKYARYANGVPGGPSNPLGARVLYLYRVNRGTYYRIHGTNEPRSIGRSVSNGCIRMINDQVVDLYNRVPVGTQVVLL